MSILLAGCGHSATAYTGSVDVDPSAPGATVPDDFLGISTEWWLVPLLLDGDAGATSMQLLRNFADEGHRLGLRVGGNSQDQAWWNPGGAARPAGVSFDLGAATLSSLASVSAALGTRLVLGLNLALDDADNAAELAAAALAALPDRIDSFELGNEPDRYVTTGARPSTYDWSAYLDDRDRFHDAIAARVPGAAFAGPALASRAWLPKLVAALPTETRWSLVTSHVYAYPGCAGSTPPQPLDLLSAHATSELAARYAPVAVAAHQSGHRHRMAEMNSVSCGGLAGVSNVYASALWAVDVAFELFAAGLDGVNFHMPGNYAAWDSSVHPLYYGLRLFSLATARGGRLLPLTVTSSSRVRAWATLGSDGQVRVALLNEDPSSDETLRMHVPGHTHATAIRLSAPALDATTGLILGGQSWDDSTDGKPTGAWRPEPLDQDGDALVVRLPALQAVVVTVP